MRAGTRARSAIPSCAPPNRARTGAGASSTRWASSSRRAEQPRRALKGTRAREHGEGTRRELPELPLTAWEETKNTLHLWTQIVGKVRMASTAPRNHWWHVTSLRRRARADDAPHACEGRRRLRDRLRLRRSPLGGRDKPGGGGVVRARRRALRRRVRREAARDSRGAGDRCRDPRAAVPGAGDDTVPGRPRACLVRPRLRSSASGTSSSGRTRCSRSSRAGTAARRVRFTSSGTGSTSRSPASAARVLRRCRRRTPSTRRRTRTRSSRSASGRATRTCANPTFYSYTAPEPADLRQQPLRPGEALWSEYGRRLARAPALRRGSHGRRPEGGAARFPGERVQGRCGAVRLGSAGLESSWCPTPPQLTDILAGRELAPTPRPQEE